MREETRLQRQEQIENVAYELLEEKGFAGTSMQEIARKARASNETIYNWYGDKHGLFKALVTRNAAEVKSLLERELTSSRGPLSILDLFGPKLLELLLGDRAIDLNRAAAADSSGELGAIISQAGRESVLPLLIQVLEEARRNGLLYYHRPEEAAALYLDLLVGDLQIRRIIGRVPSPDKRFCNKRAKLATSRLCQLLGAEE